MKIEILLATYNGERHLNNLLDSILEQHHKDILITISDDCSSDNTQRILSQYKERFPKKIKDISDDIKRGPSQNFSYLLENSKYELIFFADQDDIWEKDKLSIFLKRFKRIKKRYGENIPILIFSDMTLIDEDNKKIHPSYYRYCMKRPDKKRLKDLLIQNNMLGCVQAFNKRLAKLASPIPKEAVMHDWWIALVASSMGKIFYINKKTIRYRQHDSNAVGARRPGIYNYRQMLPWSDRSSYIRHFNCIFSQADALLKIYKDSLNKKNIHIIRAFLSLKGKRLIERIMIMFRNRFFRNNIHETLEAILRYKSL